MSDSGCAVVRNARHKPVDIGKMMASKFVLELSRLPNRGSVLAKET